MSTVAHAGNVRNVLGDGQASDRLERKLFIDPGTEADSPLSAQKLTFSNRCILLAAILAKGEV